MRRTWGLVWRIAASLALVLAAWGLLMLAATMVGLSLLSYLVAGVVLVGGVWCLVLMWYPFLRPPRRPDMPG